jgi:hypothetical protein
LYESRAVPFFTRALRADGKNVRNVEFCTQFLWYAASLRGELVADSEQALIGVLKSRQPVASTRAAWALGDLCSENAKHELIQALDADDPTLPGAACMVLGLLGGDDARQALLKVQAAPHLYGERTVRASQEALDLLIRLCVPDVGQAVLDLLRRHEGESFRTFSTGWISGPSVAAVRKAWKLNLRSIVPDLRAEVTRAVLVRKHPLAGHPYLQRLVYVIHRLGGDLAPEEREVLVLNYFLEGPRPPGPYDELLRKKNDPPAVDSSLGEDAGHPAGRGGRAGRGSSPSPATVRAASSREGRPSPP